MSNILPFNSSPDELRPFYFNGMTLRAMLIDGEPWFVAMDVANVLEYTDGQAMTRRLDSDEIQNRQIVGFGNRGASLINESGLYSAILGSRKPEAKAFKKWVTSVVLRDIRKTGGYNNSSPVELTGQELMARALLEAQNVLAAKDQKLAELAPIAEYYETNVTADDVLTIKDWGLIYGIQGNDAYDILKDKGIVYRKKIGERWSQKRRKKEDVFEYRIRKGTPSAWFSLRSQHNTERHHNGQVRQTLYVVAQYSVDIAKAAGIYHGSQAVLEIA